MKDIETLKKEILRISKELGLSHIGSNLSALPVYYEIYKSKSSDSIVVADNAHAGLSHLIVKHAEMYKNNNEFAIDKDWVEKSIQLFGIHCDRKAGCDASGGSLGHGIGIGIGYALADAKRNVYVIVSDGSMMEGSNWEALRIIHDLKINNIYIHCNFNGYTAVRVLTKDEKFELRDRMESFCGDRITFYETSNGEGFDSVEGHYKVL